MLGIPATNNTIRGAVQQVLLKNMIVYLQPDPRALKEAHAEATARKAFEAMQ